MWIQCPGKSKKVHFLNHIQIWRRGSHKRTEGPKYLSGLRAKGEDVIWAEVSFGGNSNDSRVSWYRCQGGKKFIPYEWVSDCPLEHDDQEKIVGTTDVPGRRVLAGTYDGRGFGGTTSILRLPPPHDQYIK